MILEEKKSFVSNFIPLPQQGNLLRFQWVNAAPERGRLLGFLAVYQKANRETAIFTEQLKDMDSEALKRCLGQGSWLPGLSDGRDPGRVLAIPAGNVVFSVDEQIFRAPYRIELWTVTEEDEELHLFYKDCPYYSRPLKLQCTVRAVTFREAEYGLFHRVKKAAETGVELLITTNEAQAEYEDGAIQYRLRTDPRQLAYPVSSAAIGKPLQFYSTQAQTYDSRDFIVEVDETYRDSYQLEVR